MAETNIGLFGGTFNPVHNGHLAIVEAFLNSEIIDKIWVLLTQTPPHKSEEFAPYNVRLEMLKSAFFEMNNVTLSTVEQKLPQPNYTFQTIQHLKATYPEKEFYYCMGSDSLSTFHTWMHYESILKECKLLVAKRPGFDISTIESKILEKSHIVHHIPLEISSTQIRKDVRSGKDISAFVPEKVNDIIDKESLYR